MSGRSKGGKPAAKAGTPLRRALRSDSPLQPLVQDGVAAVARAHRGLIDEVAKADIQDSLDLDAALETAHPEENRWDYLLGQASTKRVVALESHTANDKEIKVVIEKREAARRQLRDHFRDGVQPAAWIWVTEGQVGFSPMEKAMRKLDQAGITFASRKVLQKHLPKA